MKDGITEAIIRKIIQEEYEKYSKIRSRVDNEINSFRFGPGSYKRADCLVIQYDLLGEVLRSLFKIQEALKK